MNTNNRGIIAVVSAAILAVVSYITANAENSASGGNTQPMAKPNADKRSMAEDIDAEHYYDEDEDDYFAERRG